VPSPLAQALYLTRQHYKRTVPSREYTNIIILSIHSQNLPAISCPLNFTYTKYVPDSNGLNNT